MAVITLEISRARISMQVLPISAITSSPSTGLSCLTTNVCCIYNTESSLILQSRRGQRGTVGFAGELPVLRRRSQSTFGKSASKLRYITHVRRRDRGGPWLVRNSWLHALDCTPFATCE